MCILVVGTVREGGYRCADNAAWASIGRPKCGMCEWRTLPLLANTSDPPSTTLVMVEGVKDHRKNEGNFR